MADTSESEIQVFLSYAHRDNEALLDGQRGWVDSFQRTLRVRLGQLLGGEPRIWWDQTTLRGNHVFAGVIDEGLDRSAVLIPVVSPSYTTSEWCRKELKAFCAAAEMAGGERIGSESRIFKVLKTWVEPGKQPTPLKDLLGFEFYRKDDVTGRLREFQLQDAARVDPEYIQKIDDLAESIRLFLGRAVPGGLRSMQGKPVLYLAESTSDLGTERERVLRTLRQRGYSILPDRPLPTVGSQLRQQVNDCLARSVLSIHLIGANYGAIPEEETASVVEIQNQLASERSADPAFCRLIWMHLGLAPTDERQQSFVERIRNDSDAQRGAEVLPTTLEVLETIIQDRLKPREESEPHLACTERLETADELRYLYLLCDRRDVESAETLRDFLYECEERLEVTLPLFEGNEADVRRYHKENLTTCDGVLLFFGEAIEPWLRTKLLDLRKAASFARKRPLTAKAVYLAPPASAVKERFRTREAVVLRGSGEPTAEALAPFLGQLGLGETG